MMDFALPEKHRKNTRMLFIIFSLFAVTLSLWMFLFNIDIISNAEGQVIPAGEVKTVQHLEGGIIDQILIKEFGSGDLETPHSVVGFVLAKK